ncbi:MAG TPA: protein kinase [Thermoanaerobaculia bacterium]|nr:protein kinase [Thermoanaerobaculia bacterium]
MSSQDPEAAPHRAAPLDQGARLGRFEVVARLGRGGMGEVYRARDTRLGREVAVKVITHYHHRGSQAVARFEREARAASALNHPNIVTVYDIDEHDGFPYIVMELVQGTSLRSLLEGGPLPLERALGIGSQIARGLTAAHERGIVHRDLKPENVQVTPEGAVKLLDFGLAQFVIAAPEDLGHELTEEHLTMEGSLLGTLGYMAPEVISGAAADHRADQFSLGAIFFEMLGGRRPFAGRSATEVVAATLRDEPPSLSTISAGLPAPLDEMVRRCLRKSPQERFASTGQLLAILEVVAAAPAAEPPPQAERPLFARLPAALTPLVDREREVEQLEGLLRDPEVRLVTLTGTGGCGKTRVALRVAENLHRESGLRVAFVPLATHKDPDLLPVAIAREMRVRPTPGQTELEAVRAEFSVAEATLLLLDNFEHLTAAAPLVGELLAECPRLKVLVTSREVLRLYGEHDVHLPPLEMPPADSSLSPEQLAAVPAVALFLERARAANPRFSLDAESAPAVAELCRRLEGLPLALELAAARSRLLSPQAMLARLGSRLQLQAPLRDLPGRQQTLRRTIDWSHDLLDDAEQTLFRRLGVFAGGFTLEAAQAVVDPFEQLGLDLIDRIGSLVDKSLVMILSQEAGEERFGMLGTMREYAADRLASSGEAERTSKAHAAYYLVLAEEGGAALAAAEDPGWLERLETEHDNFRAALYWLVARGDADWGLRLALGLFHFWERAEHLTEGRRWFAELLRLAGDGVSQSTRARALFCAGVLGNAQGDDEEARQLQLQSLDIYRQLGDPWGQAVALNALSVSGDPEAARAMAEEALALWKRLGDELGYARTLCNLAMALRKTGHYDEARSVYEDAAELFAARGDQLGRAWALNHQGDLAREHGRFEPAEALYRRALEVFEAIGDAWGIASSLADLGTLERQRGERQRARELYRQALSRFHALEHRRGVARLLELLACLSAELGEDAQALLLAAGSTALRERIGAPLAADERRELDQGLESARRALKGDEVRAIEERGRRLTLTAILEEALRERPAQA